VDDPGVHHIRRCSVRGCDTSQNLARLSANRARNA
jgi:hypothetical protein